MIKHPSKQPFGGHVISSQIGAINHKRELFIVEICWVWLMEWSVVVVEYLQIFTDIVLVLG